MVEGGRWVSSSIKTKRNERGGNREVSSRSDSSPSSSLPLPLSTEIYIERADRSTHLPAASTQPSTPLHK